MVKDSGHVTPTVMSDAWAQRYLVMLGVKREAPSLGALGRLTRAHIAAMPFVNVASILRRQAHPGEGPVPPLDVEERLQSWEQRAGGGVCFDVTEMLSRLLVALGYAARPVSGQVGPTGFHGAHQGVLVEIDGGRYLVDAGNGAPFFEPIPLDAPFEVHRAGLGWRFYPDERPGWWAQDRLIESKWTPFCVYDLGLPDPEVRSAAYQRLHLPGESWVTGNLVMVQSDDDVVHALRDDQLTRFTPAGKEVTRLTSDAQYEQLARDIFGLPALPVLEARRILAENPVTVPRPFGGPDTAPGRQQ